MSSPTHPSQAGKSAERTQVFSKMTGGARVRFLDNERGALSVLEIEVARTQPLIAALHRALGQLGIMVEHVRSTRRSSPGGMDRLVHRIHVAGGDGRPVRKEHRCRVQTEVLALLAAVVAIADDDGGAPVGA